MQAHPDAARALEGFVEENAHGIPLDALERNYRDASHKAELRTVAELAEAYPGDVGVVTALLLNLVHLEAGEAIFIPAGNLHAYLRGVAVEVMANSDNVLRGGLTPKHVDVPELLRLLHFGSGPPPIVRGVTDGPLTRYDTVA